MKTICKPDFADTKDALSTRYAKVVKTTIDGEEVEVAITRKGELLVNGENVGSASANTSSICRVGNAISVSSGKSNRPTVITKKADISGSLFDTGGIIAEQDIITSAQGGDGIPKKGVLINSDNMLLLMHNSDKLSMLTLSTGEIVESAKIVDGTISDFACDIVPPTAGVIDVADCYVLCRVEDSQTLQCKKFSIADSYDGGETRDHTNFDPDLFSDEDRIAAGIWNVSEGNTFHGKRIGRITATKNRLFFCLESTYDVDSDDNENLDDDFMFSVDKNSFPSTGTEALVANDAGGDGYLNRSLMPIHDTPTWWGIAPNIITMSYNNDVAAVRGKDGALYCWAGEERDHELGRVYSDGWEWNTSCFRLFNRALWSGDIEASIFQTGGSDMSICFRYAGGQAFIMDDDWVSSYDREDTGVWKVGTGYPQKIFSISPNTDAIAFFSDSYSYESLSITDISYTTYYSFSYDLYGTTYIDIATTAIAFDDVSDLESGMLAQGLISVETSDDSSGIAADTVTRYRISMLYDGITESPLSEYYVDATSVNAHKNLVTITLTTAFIEKMSKRVSSILLYAATTDSVSETSFYRKVAVFDLVTSTFGSSEDGYVAEYPDTGKRLEAFEASSGYAEGLKTISANRGCQCAYRGHLYAANILIEDNSDARYTGNVLLKSLPLQTSGFDYARDYSVLPFTATALVGSGGRLYAFSDTGFCIINPDSLSIDGESKAFGVDSDRQLVDTDYGLFAYSNNNVYHVDGLNVVALGTQISTKTDQSSLCLEDIEGVAVISYLPKRQMLVVVGNIAEGVCVFAYSIEMKKWGVYIVEQAIGKQIVHAYQHDDNIVVSGTNYSYTLFSEADYRNAEISLSLDFGDSKHKWIVYSISPQYRGMDIAGITVLLNGVAFTSPSTISTSTDNKLTLQFPESQSEVVIDRVRVTARRLVLT